VGPRGLPGRGQQGSCGGAADYNLNTDAGLRAAIIGAFFAELKVEFKYDSTPAEGAKKEDLRFLVGVGWTF
jgi:hypothetical protein